MQKMNYERLVRECKRHRLEAEQATSKFFLFLTYAEKEYPEVWGGAGCATFEQFLRSNQICNVDHYRFFTKGVAIVGRRSANELGKHFTIRVGKMQEPMPRVVEALEKRANNFIEINKVQPGEQTVREWCAEEVGASVNASDNRGARQVSELHRLRAENIELRTELRAKERRIAELEAMLALPSNQEKSGGEARA